MRQCEKCLNLAALPRGCAVALGDVPAEDVPERNYCLPFDDGIPAEYWEDREKCPYFMAK